MLSTTRGALATAAGDPVTVDEVRPLVEVPPMPLVHLAGEREPDL